MKKNKKNKEATLATKLRKQADEKNQYDCAEMLSLLDEASKEGEYERTVKLKVNQANYIKTLGLNIVPDSDRIGYYQISWKDEE